MADTTTTTTNPAAGTAPAAASSSAAAARPTFYQWNSFDPKKLALAPAIETARTGQTVIRVFYDGAEGVKFLTPKLDAPFGASIYDPKAKRSRAVDVMELNRMKAIHEEEQAAAGRGPPRNKDDQEKASVSVNLNGKIGEAYKAGLVQPWDDRVCELLAINSKAYFGRVLDLATIRAQYTSSVYVPKDDRFPESHRLKMPRRGAGFATAFFDSANKPMTAAYCSRNCKAQSLVQIAHLWVMGKTYGTQWNLDQCRVYPDTGNAEFAAPPDPEDVIAVPATGEEAGAANQQDDSAAITSAPPPLVEEETPAAMHPAVRQALDKRMRDAVDQEPTISLDAIRTRQPKKARA